MRFGFRFVLRDTTKCRVYGVWKANVLEGLNKAISMISGCEMSEVIWDLYLVSELFED